MMDVLDDEYFTVLDTEFDIFFYPAKVDRCIAFSVRHSPSSNTSRIPSSPHSRETMKVKREGILRSLRVRARILTLMNPRLDMTHRRSPPIERSAFVT